MADISSPPLSRQPTGRAYLYLQAARVQGRVIYALLLRELLTRFGKSRAGFLTIFVEPVVFLCIMLTMHAAGGRFAPFGVDIALFVATGIVPFLLMRSILTKCLSCASANRSLFFITEVKLNDAYIARILVEYIIYNVVFWFAIAAIGGWDAFRSIESLFGVIHAFIALTLLAGGIGICLAALQPFVPQMKTFVMVAMRITLLAGGVIISIFSFPYEIRQYLMWNPLLHVLEYLRSAFFPVYESSVTNGSLAYVWEITGVSWFFGLILVRRLRTKLLER